MQTFSALLAVCVGNSPVTGEFPTQRPVMRSSDVFFVLRPNVRLSKQSWCWWFETPSRPSWRHSNGRLSKMKLVLSITFFICFAINGNGMCSTVPFKSRWTRGYNGNSFYHHHQIRNLSYCYYFSPISVIADFCFCYCCAVNNAYKWLDTLWHEGHTHLFFALHYTFNNHDYGDLCQCTDACQVYRVEMSV